MGVEGRTAKNAGKEIAEIVVRHSTPKTMLVCLTGDARYDGADFFGDGRLL
jgi:hypothetical protein